MRKIEQQMIRAAKALKSKSIGNTSVTVSSFHGASIEVLVVLHGNLIARLVSDAHGLKRCEFTLAGWNTPTTRSRVNALLTEFAPHGARVYSHKFEPFYRPAIGTMGVPIGTDEWIAAYSRKLDPGES